MMDAIAHQDKRRPISWGDGSRKLLAPIDTLSSRWYVRYAGDQKDLENHLPCDSVMQLGGEQVAVTQPLSTQDAKARFAALAPHGTVLAAMRML